MYGSFKNKDNIHKNKDGPDFTINNWHWTPEKQNYCNLNSLICIGDLETGGTYPNNGVEIAKRCLDHVSKRDIISEF